MMFRMTIGIITALFLALISAQSASNAQPAESAHPYTQTILTDDGLGLAADVYLPSVAERVGTVLVHTPYNRRRYDYTSKTELGAAEMMAQRFVDEGFAFVVVDARGRYGSEGVWNVSAPSPQDSSAILDWIVEQDWSNGKIGMVGCSYPGQAAIYASMDGHPALKTVIAEAAGGMHGSHQDRHRYSFMSHGLGFANYMLFYYDFMAREGEVAKDDGAERPSYRITGGLWNLLRFRRLSKLAHHYPVEERLRLAGIDLPHYQSAWEARLSWPASKEFFDFLPFINDLSSAKTPILHVNTWADSSATETLTQAALFRVNAETEVVRDNQFVIMGPSNHCAFRFASEETVVGDLNVGDARFAYVDEYVRWFDAWLRDDQKDYDAPNYRYYQMGDNEWRESDVWPPAGTTEKTFFLTSEDGANTFYGDGRLSTQAPLNAFEDSLWHDPREPVKTLGMASIRGAGFREQSRLHDRQDVLFYTSDPLDSSLTLSGRPHAVLYVSTDAKDADFFVKLVDVHPNGDAYNVMQGGLRLRYRADVERPQAVEPNEIYKVMVDLVDTAHTFKPGHRVQIQIASSDFPRLPPNSGMGGDEFLETEYVSALNKVHGSSILVSKLVLSVEERAD